MMTDEMKEYEKKRNLEYTKVIVRFPKKWAYKMAERTEELGYKYLTDYVRYVVKKDLERKGKL